MKVVNISAKPKTLTRPAVCDQEKRSGKCRAMRSMVYFNKALGKCRYFRYSGCGGNENRFRTIKECQRTCEGKFRYNIQIYIPD